MIQDGLENTTTEKYFFKNILNFSHFGKPGREIVHFIIGEQQILSY
jgi:hypothetical protein